MFIKDDTCKIEIVPCCRHSDNGQKHCVHRSEVTDTSVTAKSGKNLDSYQLSHSAVVVSGNANCSVDRDQLDKTSSSNIDVGMKLEPMSQTCRNVRNCTSKCDCRTLPPQQCFLCPYVHVCCVGKLVYIQRFLTVTELAEALPRQTESEALPDRTQNETHIGQKGHEAPPAGQTLGKATPGQPVNQIQSVIRRYLLVDMRDVIYLGHSSQDYSFRQSGIIDNNKQQTECLERENKNITAGPRGDNVEANHTTSNENRETKSMMPNHTPLFHKHLRPDGVAVFCRKKECLNQTDTKVVNNHTLLIDSHFHELKNTFGQNIKSKSAEESLDITEVTTPEKDLSQPVRDDSKARVMTPKYVVLGKCVNTRKRKLGILQMDKAIELDPGRKKTDHQDLRSDGNSVEHEMCKEYRYSDKSVSETVNVQQCSKPTSVSGDLSSQEYGKMSQNKMSSFEDSTQPAIRDVSEIGQLNEVVIYLENKGSVVSEMDIGGKLNHTFIAECDIVLSSKIFKVKF